MPSLDLGNAATYPDISYLRWLNFYGEVGEWKGIVVVIPSCKYWQISKV